MTSTDGRIQTEKIYAEMRKTVEKCLTYRSEHLWFVQHDRLDRMLAIQVVDSNVDPIKLDDLHQSNLNQHHQQPMITSSPGIIRNFHDGISI